MFNLPLVARLLSKVLFLEAVLLLISGLVGYHYGEVNCYYYFGVPLLIAIAIGFGLRLYSKGANNKLNRRDGYLLATSTWLVLSLVGTFPFILSGSEPRFACALFETVSGFTTTGASAMSNLTVAPYSILLFRSLSHWVGALGIIFLTLVLLPSMASSDMRLFTAEATGIGGSKLHSHVSTTARWLWGIYVSLTLLAIGCFYGVGMNLFDAVNHAFSVIGTGGFSTKQASIAAYQSRPVEYVTMFFMLLSSINFSLLYLLIIKRRFKQVFSDGELRCFFIISLGAIASIALIRCCQTNTPFTEVLHSSAFAVLSLQSTAGFISEDYMQWPVSTHFFLLFVTMVGACAGSTAGGIKCIRILTSFKVMRNEFKHMLHPKAMYPIRINDNEIGGTVVRTVFAFLTAYIALLFVSVLVFGAMGTNMYEAFGLAVTLLSNSGPAVGSMIGATGSWDILPDVGLWYGSFLMLAGRLEIFTLLLPLTAAFWRDH